MSQVAADLLGFVGERRFATILADPPWQFTNKTGKVAPEHRRLSRYGTMKLDEIMNASGWLSIYDADRAPLSVVPNALLPEGLAVMKAWGFAYKSNIVWHKIRRDGGSDGRGVGFYFRNVTDSFSSACAAAMPARLRRAAARSTCLLPASASIRASPIGNTRSSRRAVPGPVSGAVRSRHPPGWVTWGDQAVRRLSRRPGRPMLTARSRPPTTNGCSDGGDDR